MPNRRHALLGWSQSRSFPGRPLCLILLGLMSVELSAALRYLMMMVLLLLLLSVDCLTGLRAVEVPC